VRNILRRHSMDPAPQRRQAGMRWAQFLKLHWEVLAAMDFFTVEVAIWHGLVTYYVLVVMELATRRVQIADITPHPTAACMQQYARQLTDPCEWFLVGKRYLLPQRCPNLNAHCERFVRSSKEEALNRMLMLGERSLHYVIQQYLIHYHTERNHHGLGNQLLAPVSDLRSHNGQVRRRKRLGGLLSYYYRDAA
jgi:putative transposase